MRRMLTALTTTIALVLAIVPTVLGADARIISVVKIGGDPGLLELSLGEVRFTDGTIVITGTVTCPSYASVLWVDAEVVQARGTSTLAQASATSPACNEPFSVSLAPVGSAFRPGVATVELDTFVCGFGCAGEHIRATVVLLPG